MKNKSSIRHRETLEHQPMSKLRNLHLRGVVRNSDQIKRILDAETFGNEEDDRQTVNYKMSAILKRINEQQVIKDAVKLVLSYAALPTEEEFQAKHVSFSFVNKYTPKHHLKYHSDLSETVEDIELGLTNVFVIVSIGATRTLYFKNKSTGEIDESYDLADGDVLFFHPDVQMTHEHGMDKQKESQKEESGGIRYSLVLALDCTYAPGRAYWQTTTRV